MSGHIAGFGFLFALPWLIVAGDNFSKWWIAFVVSIPLWFSIWCLVVYRFYRLIVSPDSQFNFNEILIYQDRIVINGETFDPKRIEIKYEHRRHQTHGVVLCADKCICAFIHESIFGRLTGENPATVVDVLQKIKQGIHIDGPVEQKFERRLFGYVVLAVLMLEVLLFYGLARWR
jgi:hypothetical protein